MTQYTPYRAAFVQFDVKQGDTAANRSTVIRQIEQLAAQDVRLAVLPEMWSCGFDNENLAIHAAKTPEVLDEISALARKYRMVIVGSMPEATPEGIYNTQYVADTDGSIAGAYRKVHLFSLTGEDKYFLVGRENVVCETAVGRLGLMICYDLRFPELARVLTLKGADVLVISAQWPVVRITRWDILAQARAIENQIYVVATNRCGLEGKTQFGGHSVIVAPGGDVLEMADQDACARFAEIDFRFTEQVREKIPSMKERVPEAYHV